MKIGILVLFGIFSTAIGIENIIGVGQQQQFYFEVTKILNETMVYHIKQAPGDCKSVHIKKIHLVGLFKRYGNAKIDYDPLTKVYDVTVGEHEHKFVICESGVRPVNLEHDIVTLDTDVCQFSTSFCDIQGGTAFWMNTNSPDIVATGEGDQWILGQEPMVRLLVIRDNSGTFMLQLLRIVLNELNQKVWITNVDELRVREIPCPVNRSVSRLGKYIPHAEFFNIGSDSESEDENEMVRFRTNDSSRLIGIEQMIFCTLILVLILIALYVLDRFIGIMINCCILRKTQSKGCAATCFKPFSQNMMIHHLYQCYIGKLQVSESPYESYTFFKNIQNSKLGKDRISMNIYDSVDTGYV